VRQPFRRQGNGHVLDTGEPPCLLATIFGSKLESWSRGTENSTGPASVSTVWRDGRYENSRRSGRPGHSSRSQVIIQLALQRALDQP